MSLHNQNIDKLRVLVLGDSGVGKTSLVNLICNDTVIQNPPSTVGCYAEVKLFEYIDKPYFIEFIEVGGKIRYENARSVFYTQVNGLLLVHDLTNRNSYNNLKKWISELFVKLKFTENFRWKDNGMTDSDLFELEIPNQSNGGLPVLILGNKEDLLSKDTLFKQSISNIEENGNSNVYVSAHNPLSFSTGSVGIDKLHSFYTKMINQPMRRIDSSNSINTSKSNRNSLDATKIRSNSTKDNNNNNIVTISIDDYLNSKKE